MSDLSEGRDALDQLDERVRRLGATLAELGRDTALHGLADEIPEARERLACVGRMTESAANKVLNRAEAAQPVCQSAAIDAEALAGRLASLAVHPDLGVGEARAALTEAVEALRHHRPLPFACCRAQPCSNSSARSMPPDSIEIIACSRTAVLPW